MRLLPYHGNIFDYLMKALIFLGRDFYSRKKQQNENKLEGAIHRQTSITYFTSKYAIVWHINTVSVNTINKV